MKAIVAGFLLLVPPVSGESLSGRVEHTHVLAAPHIVMIHGGSLRERIVIADWTTNQRLMSGLIAQTSLPDSALRSRPFFDVALFWGSEWKTYAETPERLQDLRPSQANQFARLYPAVGKLPALLVFRAGLAGMARPSRYRRVSPDALDILAKHGVGLRQGDR
jgi:hypothetical protein